jgi:hypothetical protein
MNKFLSKLSQFTGKQFRLPTEAEWEFAARGGNRSLGYKYPGSNSAGEVAWYKANSSAATHPVAQKKANELGLYDMSGNVWEPCLDYYDSEYYSKSPVSDPCNTTVSSVRVMRGGGFGNDRWFCRTTMRAEQVFLEDQSHMDSNSDMGIRLVMSDLYQQDNMPIPEAIDLGLSVKWASFNLGASKPEEYGDYFAWGETEPKNLYLFSTYKLCRGSYNTMTKYCTNSDYGYNGFVDGKTVLDLEDDAAHVRLGRGWRMPTETERKELIQNCTWEWMSVNGVNGQKVTGSNGNSIFIPAAGYHYYSYDYYSDYLDRDGTLGIYWTSTRPSGYAPNENYSAFCIGLNSYGGYGGFDSRENGLPIRAVYDDNLQYNHP